MLFPAGLLDLSMFGAHKENCALKLYESCTTHAQQTLNRYQVNIFSSFIFQKQQQICIVSHPKRCLIQERTETGSFSSPCQLS